MYSVFKNSKTDYLFFANTVIPAFTGAPFTVSPIYRASCCSPNTVFISKLMYILPLPQWLNDHPGYPAEPGGGAPP